MARKLATEIRQSVTRATKREEAERRAAAEKVTAARTAERALIDQYAEEKVSFFVDALTEKLRAAAKEGERSAAVRWSSYDEFRGRVAHRAMQVASEHFQEQGLVTEVRTTDNGRMGAANGEEGIRDYISPTEWTAILTASLPEASASA